MVNHYSVSSCRRYLLLITILGLFALCVVSPAGAVRYSATVLNGVIGDPAGINDAGQVISVSSTIDASGTYTASYLWTNGTSQPLGSYVNAINDSGHTAGYDEWDLIRSPLIDGGAIPGILGEGEAWGINNLGQVVGVVATSAGPWHAFRYDSGTITDLTPSWTGASIGMAINLSGQIVVNQDAIEGSSYLWDDGVMTPTGLWNARAISDSGQTLGWNVGGPAIWRDGVTTQITVLPGRSVSWLSGINKNGQVVGSFADGGFLWEDGVMSDINSLIDGSPGLTIDRVGGINDNGQIIASSSYGVVLLAPVPEPSCLAALIVGMAGLLRLKRR